MNYLILAILFFLSGFFMKYSDDLFDRDNNVVFASIFGILCALASATATASDVGAAYVFISILIGNLIALKVDGTHHIITLVVFVCACLISGIPDLNLVVLLICIIAAFSDEIGHEMVSNFTENKFINLFFEYRFVMKVVIFLLAIFGAFDIWIFICFICFEVAYEMAGIVFEKLS